MTIPSTLSYRIREVTEADIPALRDLAFETFPMACPPEVSEDDITRHCAYQFDEDRLLSHLDHPGHYLAVAEAEGTGELMGYLLLLAGAEMDVKAYQQLRATPSLGVDKIYVRKKYHGSGIAGALMNHAVDQAKSHAYSSLWLATNSGNERAIRFYNKQGYDVVGSRIYYVGKTYNEDVVFERLLIDPPEKTD